MSVNVSIALPAQTQIGDVALVLAALDGIPTVNTQLSHGDGWCADLDGGVSQHVQYVTVDSLPECVNIIWANSNKKPRSVLYHFEYNNGAHRGILPGSTPWWIVAAKRLVDVFGGIADYNDCDDHDQDYVQPVADDISASDGEAWYRWQERLLNVKPITKEELEEARQYAAYKD